jgi:hypothetical protein
MTALQRFIEYVHKHDQVWCCTREQIALERAFSTVIQILNLKRHKILNQN